ncbi:MAG: lipid-A-disaccharide synthase [Leptospiraceae bacterium]|nr:lipid-A-disaccharide synthase [Leptospiraceae bacterium]
MSDILIIAGEHSGDLLGGGLMKSLKSLHPFEFFGIGAEKMKENGLNSLANIEDLNVVGFVGALLKYRKLKKIANQIVEIAIKKESKLAILIDYPGFNLALAQMLKEKLPEMKIVFYVSPQIWAWRYKRIYKIKKLVDLMLLLFPFEKKIYDKENIPNVFVGHPIIERMPGELKKGKAINLSKTSYKICLMPGSRSGEIKRLLTIILEAAYQLKLKIESLGKEVEFILPGISEKEDLYIRETLDSFEKAHSNFHVHYEFLNSAKCIESSDQVIVASGTATLEVAYFEKPMVIIYKNSLLTHLIGKSLILIPYVGIVNILSERFICKELIQGDCTAKNIFDESFKIYSDTNYKQEMIQNLKQVRLSLGDGNASKIASDSILKLIS